jgi:hypothetical protein
MALTDITGRSSKMSPNAAILCPRTQSDPDSPQFIGITRITQGGMFWVSAWNEPSTARPFWSSSSHQRRAIEKRPYQVPNRNWCHDYYYL